MSEGETKEFKVGIIANSGATLLEKGKIPPFDVEDITSIWAPIECEDCHRKDLCYGELGDPAIDRSRQMGAERLWTSHHRMDCSQCDTPLSLKIDYLEYPIGSFQPLQILETNGCSLTTIPGTSLLLNKLSEAKTQNLKLSHHLKEIKRALRMTEAPPEDVAQAAEYLFTLAQDLVLVFGPYGEGEKKLHQLKSKLIEEGFDARLLKELPGIGAGDPERKARAYGSLARFIVLLDDAPAGQIAEYVYLRDQRSIVARLVPSDGGSTAMIGGEAAADLNHIESFSYEDEPGTALNEAIEWAEDFRKRRRRELQR